VPLSNLRDGEPTSVSGKTVADNSLLAVIINVGN
jgi:hypothetical protein